MDASSGTDSVDTDAVNIYSVDTSDTSCNPAEIPASVTNVTLEELQQIRENGAIEKEYNGVMYSLAKSADGFVVVTDCNEEEATAGISFIGEGCSMISSISPSPRHLNLMALLLFTLLIPWIRRKTSKLNF